MPTKIAFSLPKSVWRFWQWLGDIVPPTTRVATASAAMASVMPPQATPAQASPVMLRLSIDDLRIISRSLLHWQRTLAKRQEAAQAAEVALLDKKIYQLLQELEDAYLLQEELSHA